MVHNDFLAVTCDGNVPKTTAVLNYIRVSRNIPVHYNCEFYFKQSENRR